MLLPPRGILRPNALARRRGLSFLQAFQNGPSHPLVTRGQVATAAYRDTAGVIRNTRGGVGMSGNGWGGVSAGNTYSLSDSAGTVLVYLNQYVDGGHGIRRWITQFEGSGSNQHRMEFHVGNLDFGWFAGGVNRFMSVPHTGLFRANVPFTIAATWNAAGQAGYVSGRQVATGSAGYATTGGNHISIGYLTGYGFELTPIMPDAVYYVLVLDTALTAGEIADAEADPWWWVERPAASPRRLASASLPPFTADLAAVVAVTTAASAAVAVAASSAATIGAASAAAGQIAISASASASLGVASAAAMAVAISADVAGAVGLAGVASGSMAVSAALAAGIGLAGTAAGVIVVSASVASVVLVTTVAASQAAAVVVPPASRSYRVPADARAYSVAIDPRIYSVPANPRRYPVPPE